MTATIPHYLLMSEARGGADLAGVPNTGDTSGQWRFVLESADGQTVLEVDESEGESDQERLDLIAVVRGLESLDQPSHVTLVTSSAYVNHGFRYGLEEWRENDWQWERFGEMTSIRNADLWRRVDRALRFHRVDCRTWRFDRGHTDRVSASRPATALTAAESVGRRVPAPHAQFRVDDEHARERALPPATEEGRARRLARAARRADLRRVRGRTPDLSKLVPSLARLADVRVEATQRLGRCWETCRRWLATALQRGET